MPSSTWYNDQSPFLKRLIWFHFHSAVSRFGGVTSLHRLHMPLAAGTHHLGSGEDDGQAERWDDDARREEDGQLFAGVAGRVGVVDHSPRDAVRDGTQDVEEEEEQRPVFAAREKGREE